MIFPAASLFREALQIDATNGGIYFALGQAEFRRQAFEAAIQAFETAVAYEPGLRGEVEPYLAKARALLGGRNGRDHLSPGLDADRGLGGGEWSHAAPLHH